MKRTTLFSLMLAVFMIETARATETNTACKNGVCPYIPKQSSMPASETINNAAVIELSSANFESIIKNDEKPVIVDFYATWCQPCKAMKPIFDALAHEEKDFVFAALDGDKNSSITVQCGVKAFPSFVIFKNGVQCGKIEGGRSKEQFMAEVKKIVALNSPSKVS